MNVSEETACLSESEWVVMELKLLIGRVYDLEQESRKESKLLSDRVDELERWREKHQDCEPGPVRSSQSWASGESFYSPRLMAPNRDAW